MSGPFSDDFVTVGHSAAAPFERVAEVTELRTVRLMSTENERILTPVLSAVVDSDTKNKTVAEPAEVAPVSALPTAVDANGLPVEVASVHAASPGDSETAAVPAAALLEIAGVERGDWTKTEDSDGSLSGQLKSNPGFRRGFIIAVGLILLVPLLALLLKVLFSTGMTG